MSRITIICKRLIREGNCVIITTKRYRHEKENKYNPFKFKKGRMGINQLYSKEQGIIPFRAGYTFYKEKRN
jgi:hypothetical protein